MYVSKVSVSLHISPVVVAMVRTPVLVVADICFELDCAVLG